MDITSFSDQKLLNTIYQPSYQDTETLNEVKKEAYKRGLVTKEIADSSEDMSKHIEYADFLLQKEIRIEDVVHHFTSKGMTEESALAITNQAVLAFDKKKANRKKQEKKDSSISPWTIIFIIFIIVKWILILAR